MAWVRRVTSLKIVVFFIFFSKFSYGSESPKKILKMADGYFVPWSYYKEGKEQNFTGISYDIGKIFCKELSLQLEYQILPYSRVFKAFASGDIDINISIENMAIKDSQIVIFPPLSFVNFYIYSLKESPVTLKKMNKTRLDIGIVRGTTGMWMPWMSKNKLKFQFIEAESFEQLIKMLQHKRLDAIIVSEMSFLFQNKILKYNLDSYSKPLFMFNSPWNLRISRKSQFSSKEYLKRFTEVAQKISANGNMAKIKKKYVNLRKSDIKNSR